MDLSTILGFDPETEEDRSFTQFTKPNIEFFRRQYLRMKFVAGQKEPNYDYPYQQMVEIARAQAAADVYYQLIEIAEQNEQEKAANKITEESEEVILGDGSIFSNTSAI